MVTTDAIAAMKVMASDPKKRTILAKDSTCIGGLIIVLSNSDSSIVLESLQTLLLLCECSESCRLLKGHVGMLDQLKNILTSAKTERGVLSLAETLFNKLSETSEPVQVPLRDSSNMTRRNSSSKNTSLQGTAAKSKSIVLQLRGLHDKGDRDLCARQLVKVKGVISITFDLNKKRCILRTKLDVKPETLVTSIAKLMTMTAQQVIKDENGQETLVSFGSSSYQQNRSLEGADDILPDYLSDDSDVSIIDDRAVKRPTDEDKKKASGWFAAATNFLTNSFYW